ncbi:MAG: AAA family ATPase [bacterium]|nr:AAA family ATPase [bacterium]
MSSTRFVTFYSYKGGVGRTLSLGNMAWEAGLRGKRVVVIDFDLEAPGIPSLMPFQETIQKHKDDKEKYGGLFELILHYQKHKSHPSMKLFATEPITKNDIDDFDKGGEIYIVPAGKEDFHYKDKLQSFDWEKFYGSEGGREFFLKFRETIEYDFDKPDLVLIDSRTGLTDVGSICTILLPDRVVMLSGLNFQNLNGTRSIIDTIEAHNKVRRDSGFREPIEIITVASHVPFEQERDLMRKRREDAKEILGREIDVVFPYVPVLSLEERLLIEELGREEVRGDILVPEYRFLYGLITDAYSEKEKLITKKEKKFEDARLMGKNNEALELAKELISLYKEIKPLSSRLIYLHYFLVSTLSFQGKDEEVIEFIKDVDRLLSKGVKSDEIFLLDIYNDFGEIYYQLALKDTRKEKESLFRSAIEKFKKAIELNSHDNTLYYNCGTALLQLAKLLPGNQKKQLLQEAIEYLKKTIEIKPDFEAAFCNRAIALSDLAILLPKDKTMQTIEDAIKDCKKAIEIKPDSERIFDNYSSILIKKYHLTLKNDCLYQALAQGKQAHKLNPGYGSFNTACAYSLLGKKEKAFEWLTKSIAIKEYTKERILEEADFDPLRDDPLFQELLDNYDSPETDQTKE